ncbi:hypothetical protein Lal_00029806 [Lupinus albus]|uniref:Putative ankyrin repeat-containing domain-containing protein n=1 Tax=Lupinus albus TaxID=3870 RepID=A0A6A5MWD4_LUPAL|nr:putative ankyrin repeat-containing domain-containing protein [Lupinus albus]KAF1876458.1 hypothetical protein Lal_00029806 [Lupinus albus]
MHSSSYFPLHWESTGDKLWYASPIDFAAANGLYDLVTELLHFDTNLLIKLTSLHRIRRLKTVWDEDKASYEDVAKCRSKVARNLMLECETGRGNNSLIRAGYGGWLLYTAASAGDMDFVVELLRKNPLLVFGEGEYGVTDMLYAAARSKNCEVFNLLLDSALSRKVCLGSSKAELEENLDESAKVFKRDMVNRAIHSAARGGNWEIVKQMIGTGAEILSYRDAQGCTVLHAAAGRGQVQVVRNLITSYDIINSIDAQGNTALHVASYRGYLPVVEILIGASLSLACLTNHCGDTFLHMAVAGFRSPGFCRLDKHIELMKQLISEKIMNMKHIINIKNNDGRTALHVAVIHNIQCDIVELLMSAPSIDLNIRDVDGMTPLDYLKRRSRPASSEILSKQLVSVEGISNCHDYIARNALVTHLKTHHGIGASPGTSFTIPDADILLYTDTEKNSFDATYDEASVESNSCSSEIRNYEPSNSPYDTKSSPLNYAAKRLKFLLQWPMMRKETKAEAASDLDVDSVDSCSPRKKLANKSLRHRYSKTCSFPNYKRTLSIKTYLASPSSKKKFTAGLMQGVFQVKPHVLHSTHDSTPSSFEELSISSKSSKSEQKQVDIMGPSCSNLAIVDGKLELNYKKEFLQ